MLMVLSIDWMPTIFIQFILFIAFKVGISLSSIYQMDESTAETLQLIDNMDQTQRIIQVLNRIAKGLGDISTAANTICTAANGIKTIASGLQGEIWDVVEEFMQAPPNPRGQLQASSASIAIQADSPSSLGSSNQDHAQIRSQLTHFNIQHTISIEGKSAVKEGKKKGFIKKSPPQHGSNRLHEYEKKIQAGQAERQFPHSTIGAQDPQSPVEADVQPGLYFTVNTNPSPLKHNRQQSENNLWLSNNKESQQIHGRSMKDARNVSVSELPPRNAVQSPSSLTVNSNISSTLAQFIQSSYATVDAVKSSGQKYEEKQKTLSLLQEDVKAKRQAQHLQKDKRELQKLLFEIVVAKTKLPLRR